LATCTCVAGVAAVARDGRRARSNVSDLLRHHCRMSLMQEVRECHKLIYMAAAPCCWERTVTSKRRRAQQASASSIVALHSMTPARCCAACTSYVMATSGLVLTFLAGLPLHEGDDSSSRVHDKVDEATGNHSIPGAARTHEPRQAAI
jgi:hypothetical protein